jgi:preprotein translocase subunit SecE
MIQRSDRVAKAVSNRSGKGKPDGRAGKGAKTPAKRGDAKPARKGQGARQQAAARAKAAPKERRGFGKFLRDVRVEMGKVTWPTRKDLMQSTLVVLVAVAIASVYTGVLDFVFQEFVDLVMSVIT